MAKKHFFWPFWGAGVVPMALGGPWDQFPCRKGPNGATATHLVAFLIFGSFLTQNRLFLCGTETHCVCCTETHCVCCTERHRGHPAGGRRAVAPTLTPLVSTPTHTHPRLLTHAVGGQTFVCPFLGPGGVPMAPGGPWLQAPASFAPNGATATHLVAFLIFGSFLI